MSRRRRTWRPHTPATPEQLLDQMYGRQLRRVKHLTVIPPRSTREVWAAEEAEWAEFDREIREIEAWERRLDRFGLALVGMFLLGVVLMLVWPLALATFGGAP